MASEYLKQKYKDIQPDAPLVLTAAARRKNWWHYHRWQIALGAALLAIVGGFIWDSAHKVLPDVQIAYVGTINLPEETVKALERGLSALCGDGNGDGKAVVQVRQYVMDTQGDPSGAAAAEVTLMGDLLTCESFIFLLEDPAGFQKSCGVLCYPDGTLPGEEDKSAAGMSFPWTQCPALAREGDGLAGLSIARRGFWTDTVCQNLESCEVLWAVLTEGAATR